MGENGNTMISVFISSKNTTFVSSKIIITIIERQQKNTKNVPYF